MDGNKFDEKLNVADNTGDGSTTLAAPETQSNNGVFIDQNKQSVPGVDGSNLTYNALNSDQVDLQTDVPPSPIAPINAEPTLSYESGMQDLPGQTTSNNIGLGGNQNTEITNKKSPLVPIIIGAVVVLALFLGWLFLMYLPNTPSAVFGSSLKRSGKAMSKLIDYSESYDLSKYQSYKVQGNLKINGGKDLNINGNIDGEYGADGSTKVHADISIPPILTASDAKDIALDLLADKDKQETYPDIYLKTKNLNNYFKNLGYLPNMPGGYDDRWFLIDSKQIAELMKTTSIADETKEDDKEVTPSKAQIYDATRKSQVVLEKYLYTSDKNNAVLENKQYIGPEVKYDRDTYHYKVGYNKDNLLKMYDELAKALDSSKLNDWSMKVNDKSISKFMRMDINKRDISGKLKADYTFDMWADRKTKLIGAVSFNDKDEQGYETDITFAQMYSGRSDEVPFKIEYRSKHEGGKANSIVTDIKVNYKTGELELNIVLDMPGDSGLKGNGNMKITPSNKPVKITPPKGSINIFDSLNIGDGVK